MSTVLGKFKRFQVSYIRIPHEKQIIVSDSLSALVKAYNKRNTTQQIGRSGFYYGLNHGGKYKGLEVGQSSTDGFLANEGDTICLIRQLEKVAGKR